LRTGFVAEGWQWTPCSFDGLSFQERSYQIQSNQSTRPRMATDKKYFEPTFVGF
jgi:hypothetical protein